MDSLNYNQQVFILNGQPVIIQRNENVNASLSNIISPGNITLQQNSLPEATSSNVSDQNIRSHQLEEDINEENLLSVQDTNNGEEDCNGSEYVAYVGESDEDESSTIHLTLEQAAELGLHFDTGNEETKISPSELPIVSSASEIIEMDSKRLSSFNIFNKNSAISNNVNSSQLQLSVFNERKLDSNDGNCNSIDSGFTKESIPVTLENNCKTSIDEPVLDNINIDGSDQQLTLIPHLINGTITYSVQINNNSAINKQLKDDNDSKNFLNSTLSKDSLSNCVVSSISDNEFNNTIKTFTNCSDLSSFVNSGLENPTNSGPSISTSAQLIQSASQNVISDTGRNVTLLSSAIIGDSATKLSNNNFTPLSDLIKCSDNESASNVVNKTNSYNLITNYQPISLTQLLNDANKKQSDKNYTPTTSSLITNVVNNCNNNSTTRAIPTKDISSVDNVKKMTLLKTNVCGNNAILLNTINKTNFTLASNNDSILIPISIDAKSMAAPASPILSTVIPNNNCNINFDNQQKSVTTLSDDDLSNLIRIRSTPNVSTVRSNVLNVTSNVQAATNSSVNGVRLSSLIIPSNTGNSKINKTLISKNILSSGTLNNTNKGCLNVNTASISNNLQIDNKNSNSNQQIANQQLPMTTGITTAAVTTTTTTTTTVTWSTVVNNVTSSISTNSVAAITPAVKSIKTANDCILSKEVSAALTQLPLSNNSNKPLGSSENPIQLVQQGHTFHSVQALTEDQLKQITAVLQQNNLSTNVPAKNILYDAETNTKIIYRVVYPEEFDLKEASTSGDEINGKTRKRGRPTIKSLIKDGSSVGQDESNSTKRKQPLPRTRSGRLSRPPRYMVRDYKRIKRSEIDDSDGAYSDYQSDHEEENVSGEKNLLPGLLLPQKRNISSTFRCPTCNKIYLGYRRMAHHFDKYSDHGTEEYLMRLKKACENKQITYNNAALNDSADIIPNIITSTNSAFNHDTQPPSNPANMVTSTTVLSAAPAGGADNSVDSSVTTSAAGSHLSAPLSGPGPNLHNSNGIVTKNHAGVVRVGIGIGFGKRRGRKKNVRGTIAGGSGLSGGTVVGSVPIPVSQSQQSQSITGGGELHPEQLRTRLKELLELCDVSELVQIAGPAVCRVLSTWELLILRIDCMCNQQNRLSTLCNEIKDLMNKFKELSSSLFQPVDSIIKNNSSTCNNNSCVTFEMEDKLLSNMFGVPCGVYKIDESVLTADKIINTVRPIKSLPSNADDVNINSLVPVKEDSGNIVSNNLNLPSMKSLEESSRCDITRLECGNSNSDSNLVSDSNVTRSDNVASLTSGQFLLSNDGSMLCDDRGTSLDDSVDQIVNEQLKKLTSSPQNHHHQEDLCKVEVDELMKNFSVLEHHHHQGHHRNHHHLSHENHHQNSMVRIRSDTDPLDPSEDDLMDGFTSITNQRTHVSASTEDLIKSLENFGSELHNSTCDDDSSRQGFINTNVNFSDRVVGVNVVNSVNVVDTLDFEVLSQDFHHSGSVNQR